MVVRVLRKQNLNRIEQKVTQRNINIKKNTKEIYRINHHTNMHKVTLYKSLSYGAHTYLNVKFNFTIGQ